MNDEKLYGGKTLKQLRALCGTGTPAPWKVTGRFHQIVAEDAEGSVDVCEVYDPCLEHGKANARFIAASRESLPALLDAVSELQAENATLKAERDRAWGLNTSLEVRSAMQSGTTSEIIADRNKLLADATRLQSERDAANKLLVEAYRVGHRDGWQEGETTDDFFHRLLHYFNNNTIAYEGSPVPPIEDKTIVSIKDQLLMRCKIAEAESARLREALTYIADTKTNRTYTSLLIAFAGIVQTAKQAIALHPAPPAEPCEVAGEETVDDELIPPADLNAKCRHCGETWTNCGCDSYEPATEEKS